MYDTVLVPTDGSEHSVRAAEHGRYLAERFDATLHVLAVVDVEAAAGVFDVGLEEGFVDRLEEQGRAAIDTVEAALDDVDQLETALVRGEPSAAILDYAAEQGVELIAMGTHGRTGLDRYVTGSVTERVVRRAEVPVLTARATEHSRLEGDYEELLVPTDGSEPAAAAVEPGLAVAEATGARVHAVHVVDVGSVALSPEYTTPGELLDRLAAAGEAMVEDVAAQARERGLEVVTEVRKGRPARDLLAYADEAGVDLVAMGTAGRTGVGRYLLGSTTERVIRHAEMPVLAVNARE